MGTYSVRYLPQINVPCLDTSQARRYSIYLPQRDGKRSFKPDESHSGVRERHFRGDLNGVVFEERAMSPENFRILLLRMAHSSVFFNMPFR